MKTPRNIGPTFMLATALSLALVATPRAGAQLFPAGHATAAPGEREGDATTALARKSCKFGQRYSSYYRRCVLWFPFDYT